ncbi:TPR domain protein [Penicillium malachiteum]|uniref:TPR domain protein n=1 Tax=Penicillium malachiteum TaxID=1324776 RepID=UPI00254924C0|nr:TPR domain protein [Penicillium malachiteum]KAJ5729762.1 TPR domain protein [Penicillium malachiteum]
MDVHDVSTGPEYVKVLRIQQEDLRKAKDRRGQPIPRQPSVERLEGFSKASTCAPCKTYSARDPIHSLRKRTVIIPKAYPTSTIPLAELRKVLLADLTLERHHRGSYVVLIVASLPDDPTLEKDSHKSAIRAVGCDETDNAIILNLRYRVNRFLQRPAGRRVVLLIKEPYITAAENGAPEIRVDHISDALLPPPYGELVPPCWRLPIPEEAQTFSGWKNFTETICGPTAPFYAIQMWSKLVDLAGENADLKANCKFGRAGMLMSNGQFDAALCDLEDLSSLPELAPRALTWMSILLQELRRFREFHDTVTKIATLLPEKLQARVEDGKYIQTCATHVGPVSVRTAPSSGRGLFTNKSVKAGDLLFCEKAFVYACHTPAKSTPQPSILVNPEHGIVTIGTQPYLNSSIAETVTMSSCHWSKIRDLHHGNYDHIQMANGGVHPVVDIFLIERIIALNCFGCPKSSYHVYKSLPPKHRPEETDANYEDCGLWSLAATINHSCDSNAHRAFIGDMMISPMTPVSLNKQMDLKHWGFKYTCVICQDALNTPAGMSEKRKGQGISFQRLLSEPKINLAQAESIIAQLRGTYTSPAAEAPRLSLWSQYLTLANAHEAEKNHEKVIEFSLKALESLGYIINVEDNRDSKQETLVMTKWGLVVDSVVSCWMTLSRAYKHLRSNLADQAKQ